MLHVQVLRPELIKKKKKINCYGCSLSYAIEDYRALFDSKKLIYFKLKDTVSNMIFCHDCLFKVGSCVAKAKNQDEISIKVTDGKKYYFFNVLKK